MQNAHFVGVLEGLGRLNPELRCRAIKLRRLSRFASRGIRSTSRFVDEDAPVVESCSADFLPPGYPPLPTVVSKEWSIGESPDRDLDCSAFCS